MFTAQPYRICIIKKAWTFTAIKTKLPWFSNFEVVCESH